MAKQITELDSAGALDSANDLLWIEQGGLPFKITPDTLGVGGGSLIVEDEGAPLTTAATTLDFVGAGVVATGSGATKTITIAGGSGVGELSDLSDVNTSTPTNRFVLVADGVDFESRLLVEADISNLGNYAIVGGAYHDGFSDFVAQEHIRWDLTGTGTIHTDNYIENVPTALSTGTRTATTYGITSDGGANDIILLEATTSLAGLLGSAKWDEIVANTAKSGNVSTSLSTGTRNATTYGITSDGGSDDVILLEATTTLAGLLGADKWDEIVANTAKTGNVTHTGDVEGATVLTIAADAVTYAKMQNVVAANRILGNVGVAGSIVAELTAANVRTMINVEDGSTADQTSIVGITGTAAQFDTALTAANFAFAGGAFHDGFSDFVAQEHIRWDLTGAGTIHTDNYIENVSTALSTGTRTTTTYGITSDGGANDIILLEATTSLAGLLGAAKWDEIVANTAKAANATHTGQVTGATALSLDITAITAQAASGALIGTDTFLVNDGGLLREATMDQLDTFIGSVTEINDLTAAVVWANVPNANITVGSVTQHESSLTILESQITNANIFSRIAGNETITGTRTYTGGFLIQNTAPLLSMIEDGVATDNKKWRWTVDAEVLKLEVTNDAVSVVNPVYTVQRTGAVVDSFTVGTDIFADNLSGDNTGDQTSIVGITGTSAQFDTALTSANFAFAGGAYHDGFSDFVADEHRTPKHSIEVDTAQLQLVGDLASPGNNQHYGTSAGGVKGWYTIPTAGAEVNDLTAAVTWANVPNANVTVGSVTQHETSLTILESQITNANVLARIAGNEVITGSWDFSSIVEIIKSGGAAADYFHLRDNTDTADLYFHYDGVNFELRSEAAGTGTLWMELASTVNFGVGIDVTGNITLTGTVDGIDIATDVAANTAKAGNVTTNISISHATSTVTVQSSDGSDGTINQASSSFAGVLSTVKFDEIVANTAKAGNATHTSHVTGATALTLVVAAITGQTDIGANLIATDEIIVSDGGVIRRADISRFNNYFNSALSFNNYTHPAHPGDDFSVDSGLLTGATVISDIDINITTDTQGHVTDANAVIATRSLALTVSLGDMAPEATAGRTVHATGMYSFNTNNATLDGETPTAYWSTIAWGQGVGGMAELASSWTGNGDLLFYRSLRDTTDNWWEWKEIYHSGMDGIGSGIDADLLDGVQGSGYSLSGHTHSAFDRASAVLSGANVFSNIVVTDGITTAIATRALTAGDIGALGLTAKAADSELLDGVDGANYLRSNVADAVSGILTFSAKPQFNSGAGLLNGMTFGSVTAASVTDLSKHIALYSTSYGFNITSSNLNLVASSVNTFSSTSTLLTSKVNHDFSAGIDVTGNITVTGLVDGIDIATDVAANTAKAGNVTTNISISHGSTTVIVNSSDGSDGTINSASTSLAGILTPAKWDEIVANTAKAGNATHTSHVTGATALTLVVAAITGQTDIGANLIATDEIIVSDGGVIRRADISRLTNYLDGALNFNNYTHPSHPGDDFSVDSGALSGATVISDIDINITTDTEGHVTDANATIATRNLTASNISAADLRLLIKNHEQSVTIPAGGALTPILTASGSNYGATGDKEIIVRIYTGSTGTQTAFIGRFKADDGGAWTHDVIYEFGTGSNNPRIGIDGSGFPAVGHNHASSYPMLVDVWETNNASRFGDYLLDLNTDVTANTAKVTNVTTNISITHGSSTVTVNSSDGTNGTINEATASLAGALSGTKFNEIVANTAKAGNVTHTGQVLGATALTLHVSAITAQTDIGANLLATDEILVSDAGVLRRADISRFNNYFNGVLAFEPVDADIARTDVAEVITASWRHEHASFGQFIIDRISTTGGSAIRYQNDDGIKGYAGFNDAGAFQTYNSSAAASGFTVSSGGAILATSYGGILEASLVGKNVAEAITGAWEWQDNVSLRFGDGNDARIYFSGTDWFFDMVDAADFRLRGGAALDLMITAIQDGEVSTYFNGAKRSDTRLTGMAIFKSDNIDATEVSLGFLDSDGTIRGRVGYLGSSILRLSNDINGSGIGLYADTTGGSSTPLFTSDPDTGVALWAVGTAVLQTQDRNATGNTSGANVMAADGTYYDIGFNVLHKFNDNVSDTLEARHGGAVAFKDASTVRTLTLAAIGNLDFPVNGMTTVVNAFTSGNYTITEGTSTTLYYLDGDTRVDTLGGCTIGPGGVANIWREATNVYYIWGTGITP